MRLSAHARAALVAVALTGPTTLFPQATKVSPGEVAVRATAVRTPASWTGVYRLQIAAPNGAVRNLHLIIEHEGNGFSGMLLTDENSVARVPLRFDGDALRISAATTLGPGELVIRETDAGLRGTFVVQRQTWTVSGRRST